jgi:hypothetical protein
MQLLFFWHGVRGDVALESALLMVAESHVFTSRRNIPPVRYQRGVGALKIFISPPDETSHQ